MMNLVGRQIDNYRVDSLLGEGGMGSVYRAQDVNLVRPVALKVMHPQYAGQPEFRRRFLQEAQAAARLGDHPSIVNIFDFGHQGDIFYMVMEFIPGSSLGNYIKHVQENQQVVKLSETLLVLAQVADALGFAHQAGVVHRDIKPDNVLLKPLPDAGKSPGLPVRAVVTDFGLAKLLEGGVQTRTGTFMGTLPYMSPEQCLGRNLDGRSDLYSLGIMLFQLATGQLPFDIKSPTEAVIKHINEPPPPPQSIRPGVPESVAAVILKSIAKKPAERYQSGEQMAAALRDAAGGLTDADVTQFAAPQTVVSLATRLLPETPLAAPTALDAGLGLGPDLDAGESKLLIAQKGQEVRGVPLEKNLITIGRADNCDIVLTAEGISRTHARLERGRDGKWTVVDLGSTNGTYLEKTRLLPDMPEPFAPGQTVRIGPYFMRLQEGQPAAGALGQDAALDRTFRPPTTAHGPRATQVHSSTGRLGLTIEPTEVEIAPGEQAEVTVQLTNFGPLVEHYSLSVRRLPEEWLSLSRDTVQLMPGASDSVQLTIRPPLDSSSTAGQRPYRLMVASTSDQSESVGVAGQVTVTPYYRYTTDMRPKQLAHGGNCRVLVVNEGNAEAMFTVVGRDQAEAINFSGEQPRLKLAPGERGAVDLKVRAKKRPLFGRGSSLPFEVLVGAAEGQRERLAGQLDVKAVLPGWLLPLLAGLSLVLCLSLVGLFTFVSGRNSDATRTAEAELALLQAETVTREFEAGAAASKATDEAATAEAEGDDDGDGISNNDERALGTLPDNPDTDGDGLNDGQEVNQYGTNPKQQDTDGDTLPDGAEVNDYHTSPTNPDTDGDGKPDGVEVAEGGDPLHEPTETPTLTATPTATETPTATPTATETPTITPTPAPQSVQATSSADRYWPSRSGFLVLCVVGQPCPTSTPEPSFGSAAVLILENDHSSNCLQFAFCVDGLAAVQFDVNALPAAESIQSALLYLTLVGGTGNDAVVEVGPATEAWNESSNGRPGCDFGSPIGTNVGLTPGEYRWNVTDWLISQRSNPGSAFGFCLRVNGNVTRTFSSRQGAANLQPRLEIVYQP